MSDTKNPFDFSDTSDLPEGLRPKTGVRGQPFWSGLFEQASGAFNTAELRAAAFRVDGIARDSATVRKAIRDAEISGLVRRVSTGRYEVIRPAKIKAV